MILVTGGLVATAAYFSVVGIASIFAYNYVPALILGTTLEAGKIAVAVYLYRYWQVLPSVFRPILLVFLTVLMIITSVGIFGFLSQGYQKTSEEHRVLLLELDTLQGEYKEKKAREREINQQIEQLPNEAVLGRIRLSREFGDELEQIRDRVTVVEPRIQDLKLKALEYESHIGPISYVAKMLGMPQDDVVFYAILMLVFVSDPLAITLTIATNMLLIRFLDRSVMQTAETQVPTRRQHKSIAEKMVARMRDMALKSQIRRKPRRSAAAKTSTPKTGATKKKVAKKKTTRKKAV
jgi:cell division protein FtsB